MRLEEQMNSIYNDLPLDEIPWNVETPPALLVDLVESGRIAPCDAVDLGCGAGNYVVWLATRGFTMTGLDLSPVAVEIATALAVRRKIDCRFAAADLTRPLAGFDTAFDFAFDWEVLHHVFPEDRAQYVANVHRLLRPGGRYLSVCFSEDDAFGGGGKYRTTPLGTKLYFSSEDELREVFAAHFDIEDLRTVEVPGTRGPHGAILAMMRKA